ncbi:ABC transporter, substrate-binding protein [Bifidobacterium dolichotidis]|uniref:ABC transporter, substrate-binding protein n=2 Tax=Bifidobacterium dolichotidis TaxID=2306976 RepID=A0A430FSL8_9BIFI|nr:ABC transporter, substrate-binding protein [Bifidobacterium dolichotidis]
MHRMERHVSHTNKRVGTTQVARSYVSRWLALLAALCMLAPLGGCGFFTSDTKDTPSPVQSASTGPVSIVATLNQWGSLAERIGGDDVKVTSILSSTNVDAHDFEPTSKDLNQLSKANVVLVNGAGYDNWATKWIPSNASTISAAETVGAIDGDNPHLWFSNEARSSVARELFDTLCRLRPKDKSNFEKNYDAWKTSEKKLENTMKTFRKEHSDLTYAATETIAAYLMSDMGFKDETPKGYLQAVQNDSEPAPSDLKSFQTLLKDREVKLLVINPQQESSTTDQIVDAASTGSDPIPVLKVTEQMPQDQKDLTGWISSLVKQTNDLINSEEDAE